MVGLPPRAEPHGHTATRPPATGHMGIRDSAPFLAQSPQPLYGTTMSSPADVVMLGVPDEEPCFSSHEAQPEAKILAPGRCADPVPALRKLTGPEPERKPTLEQTHKGVKRGTLS